MEAKKKVFSNLLFLERMKGKSNKNLPEQYANIPTINLLLINVKDMMNKKKV